MFFLIWGIKVRYKLLDRGGFFCPRCGGDRQYQHRVGRKWFSLYYIPLFPVSGPLNEHVRCDVCKGAFTMEALSRPTSGALSGLLIDGVRGVLVHVLRTGSMQNPAARATAVAEVQRAGVATYSDADLESDLGVVPGDLSGLLYQLSGQLADQGKENLLRAAVRTALADGPLSDLETSVLNSTAATLGMSQAHAMGVIVSVQQDAQRLR